MENGGGLPELSLWNLGAGIEKCCYKSVESESVRMMRELGSQEIKRRADEIAEWAREHWVAVETFKRLMETYNEN